LAFFKILDESWMGETKIWFIAEDAQGLRDSIQVRFEQQVSVGTNWLALPIIDFEADKVSILSGETVEFSASFVGADTWKWVFEGANITESFEVSPEITYTNPGSYKVSLYAQNEFGIDSLIKEDYIKVLKRAS